MIIFVTTGINVATLDKRKTVFRGDNLVFDIDLFYELCDKYGIELSDKYDRLMIRRDDSISPLVGKDIVQLFGLSDTYDEFYINNDMNLAADKDKEHKTKITIIQAPVNEELYYFKIYNIKLNETDITSVKHYIECHNKDQDFLDKFEKWFMYTYNRKPRIMLKKYIGADIGSYDSDEPEERRQWIKEKFSGFIDKFYNIK